ncbi:MAG: hypothetical protein QNJ42_18710 [Crocosphaera sp.]|nr:hypothetical protein [Crocosphaera sp.]
MDRCFISEDSCICSDVIPDDVVLCLPQFGGQSGSQFASNLVGSVFDFMGSSGLMVVFTASILSATVIKFLR